MLLAPERRMLVNNWGMIKSYNSNVHFCQMYLPSEEIVKCIIELE